MRDAFADWRTYTVRSPTGMRHAASHRRRRGHWVTRCGRLAENGWDQRRRIAVVECSSCKARLLGRVR